MNPGVPAGTMIAEISLPPSGRVPVIAVTVTSVVMSVPELVMNAFEPLITHSSPSRRAVVRVRARVRAAARLGQPERAQRLRRSAGQPALPFCSSVPNR